MDPCSSSCLYACTKCMCRYGCINFVHVFCQLLKHAAGLAVPVHEEIDNRFLSVFVCAATPRHSAASNGLTCCCNRTVRHRSERERAVRETHKHAAINSTWRTKVTTQCSASTDTHNGAPHSTQKRTKTRKQQADTQPSTPITPPLPTSHNITTHPAASLLLRCHCCLPLSHQHNTRQQRENYTNNESQLTLPTMLTRSTTASTPTQS